MRPAQLKLPVVVALPLAIMLHSVFSEVVLVLLFKLIYADQSLIFTNTICSGEEFVTDAFLPALRLAVKDVNNKILTNERHQLTLCNSYDFQSNHTMHVSLLMYHECTSA